MIPKDAVLAPLTPFSDFIEELSLLVTNKSKLATIIQGIKAQTYSNVFYLPSHPQSNQDFVCFFDNAFWLPTEELTAYLPNIEQIRLQSLFKIPMLIAYVSQFMTLLPGDVLSTGSPYGTGAGLKPPRFLQHGDCVELSIEGLGCQKQQVVFLESNCLLF